MITTTAGYDWTSTSGTVDVPSVGLRSGKSSNAVLAFSSGARTGWLYQFAAAAGDGPYYFSTYARFDTLPSAENRFMFLTNGAAFTSTQIVYLTIDASGVVKLYDEDGQITGTVTLSNPTLDFNQIEVKIDRSAAAGSHVVEARVNGVVFATSSTRSLSAGVESLVVGGNLGAEAQTTGTYIFDDTLINDGTGSFMTTYPGAYEIDFLRPDATGDASGWTNTYTNVDDITPDDATTVVASTTLNLEDLHNIEAIPWGIDTTDIIRCVAVGVRYRTSTNATGPGFKLEIEATAAGTIEQSAEITPANNTWTTNANSNPKNYPLVLYDMPGASTTAITPADLATFQIGYKETTDLATTTQITMVWLMVVHSPNQPPTTVLNSPADASSGSDTTPTLDFTGTDPEANDIRYTVQIHNAAITDIATPTTILRETKTTDDNSHVTASISVTSGRLYLITVASKTEITTDPNQPTITGASLTVAAVSGSDPTVVFDNASSSRRRLTMFYAVCSSTTSGALTVDYGGQTQTTMQIIVDEIASGFDSSTPILQSVKASELATPVASLSATLGALGNNNNAIYFGFASGNGTSQYNPGSGFGKVFLLRDSVEGNLTTVTAFKRELDTTADIFLSPNDLEIGMIAIEIKAATQVSLAKNSADNAGFAVSPSAPIVRSSSSNSAATGTAISVTAPSGVAIGDVVVISVQANGQTTIVDNNGSTAFTEDLNDYKPNTVNGHTVSIFSRRIVAGDPTTYNFTSGASDRWSIVAVAVVGVDASSIYDVAPSSGNAANRDNSGAATLDAPAITTATANALHFVCGYSDDGAGGAMTKPTGYTSQGVPVNEPQTVSTKTITAAGSTGAQTTTGTTSAPMIALSFALKAGGIYPSASATQFTVQGGDALAAGTYYWRARGLDPSGANYYGAWPTARSFTITTTIPNKIYQLNQSVNRASTY